MPGRMPEPPKAEGPHTLVLGVGNPLLGDEGFGIHVVRLLRDEGVPEGVVLEDGGTAGVDLIDLMAAYDRVIVIDLLRVTPRSTRRPADLARGSEAVGEGISKGDARGDPVPGEVVVFRLNTVELLNPDPSLSLHGCSLGGLIRLAQALDIELPDIIVVGTAPERIDWSTDLSQPAKRAAQEAAATVRGLLAGRGVVA